MNIQNCFEVIGADYNQALARFKSEEKIIFFLKLYLKDTSTRSLDDAMAAEDYGAAFFAAHTLKGVLGNMCFTAFYEKASELTELLRDGKDIKGAVELYPEVKDMATLTAAAIRECIA